MKATDPDTKAEIIESILSSLEDGKGLATVCRELSFPRKTFLDWVDKDAELSNRYERARARAADVIFEEILGIADDGTNDKTVDDDGREVVNYDHIQRSKLRVDARKWVLAKMLPKKFGDRLELGGTLKTVPDVDLSRATDEELEQLERIQERIAGKANGE